MAVHNFFLGQTVLESTAGATLASGAYTTTSLSVTAGALPPGMATGIYHNPPGFFIYTWPVVIGVPTALGTYNATVTVVGGPGTTVFPDTWNITLKTWAGGPGGLCPLIGLSSLAAPMQLGVAYSSTVTTDSGAAPFVWDVAAGALPTGLSLSAGGVLSGTPSAVGSFTFTLRATDVNACPGVRSYTVTVISCPAITVTPASPLPGGTASYAYSQTLSASGGAAPYTWSVTSGALPPGLTLSSGGVLSGVPTSAGTFTFTARAADTNLCPGTLAYSLTVVCPAIAVSSLQPIQTGFIGIPYARTFVATGGALPYTWSVASGALPTGLTLASDGAVTGTPTTLGTYTFTVHAVDGNGCPATANPPTSVTTYTVVIQGVQHMPGYPVVSGKFIAFTSGAPQFLPLAGGKVYTYENRTSTPYPTYTDGTLLTQNSNPVILDSAGRASIFIPDRSVMTYTFVVKDANDVIVYTENDISEPAVPPAASTAGLGVVPTGSILPYGGEQTPGNVAALALLGYLFCDGTAYSNAPAPTGHETLFNVIGYKYGGSSGSFQVPDYRGRMPMGAAAAGPAPIVNGAVGGEWNHVHTGPSHTHTAPVHKHGMTHNHAIFNNGWAANATVTPSPTHNGKYQVCPTSGVGSEASMTVPTDPYTSTDVSSEVLTGNPDITLVTDAQGTGNTGTGNPPYLTCSFIIKT